MEALSSRLRKESDYSLIKITPAHLELVGQELPADKLAHRTRALVIGGEALTFEKLGLWSAHVPEIRLINEYGPTETVVGCCFMKSLREISAAGRCPSAGRLETRKFTFSVRIYSRCPSASLVKST